jgi:2-polyprenyl-3-methyl-5-hydroxy-6-metoxy-1,4-benzoquinol methylase
MAPVTRDPCARTGRDPGELDEAAAAPGRAERDASAPRGAAVELRDEPLLEVIAHLRARVRAAGAAAIIVADPDRGRGCYAGERVDVAGRRWMHRPWRVWIDLADRLGLRMLTPQPLGDGRVRLAFEPLAADARWQTDAPADPRERYGAASPYQRIHKAEEPGFVIDLEEALVRCRLRAGARVLDLGVNDGTELELLMALAPALRSATFVGVDHSASAIAAARARFAADQVQLICGDVGELGDHALGRFDLVVCLGTLQSPGVDDRALLRSLVQGHLAPRGALILGLPNCRYVDGELVHGARQRNFRQPELGLVISDLTFYRRYLHQHGRQVFVTGQHTLLLTAV